MNDEQTQGCDDELAGVDDVEILEVVGLDEDGSPGRGPEPPASRREVVVGFDDEAPLAAEEATSSEPAEGAPRWNPAMASNEVEARVDAELIQRLRADYENLRKRVERERAEFEYRANVGLIQRLLPVLDGFEKALAHEPKSGVDTAVRDGLLMIYEQLGEVLRQAGLRPIPVEGQTFDPNLHDAVATDSRASEPRDTILEELRRGYLFRDRVLRHSLVKVSTNGSAIGEGEEA